MACWKVCCSLALLQKLCSNTVTLKTKFRIQTNKQTKGKTCEVLYAHITGHTSEACKALGIIYKMCLCRPTTATDIAASMYHCALSQLLHKLSICLEFRDKETLLAKLIEYASFYLCQEVCLYCVRVAKLLLCPENAAFWMNFAAEQKGSNKTKWAKQTNQRTQNKTNKNTNCSNCCQ